MPPDSLSVELLEAFGRDVLHSGRHHQSQRGVSGLLVNVGRLALKTLLPETCAGCGMSGTWLCRTCERSLGTIDQADVCRRCGHPGRGGNDTCQRCELWVPSLSASRSACAFSGSARSVVHLLKYRNQPARAIWCARTMLDVLQLERWDINLFVPVPLHETRVRVRGYNQSERIAVELSALTGLPSVAAIRRVRPTISQVGLGAAERRENVRGAFRANGSLTGLTVALIDDVLTTGATLQECAHACVDAGADCVVAATFAAELFQEQR